MPSSALPRSARARDTLVRENVGLVHFLARRLHGTLADDADLDELVSAGMLGLLRAAESFDTARGVAFSTFATARIRGAMLDELRRIDPLSRSVRARTRALQHAAQTLAQRHGRTPHTHEIAQAAGLSLSDYWQLEQDIHAAQLVALDADVDDIREPASVSEYVAAPEFDLDVEIDREREREWLRELVDRLLPDERTAIRLSFFDGLPLQHIAQILGVTESGASRIRTRALNNLRGLVAHHHPHLPLAA